MKVEYIHHSSYLIELSESILLFDYFSGKLAEFDNEKEIFVFVSHRHGDHFSKKIFLLADKYKKIKYILSDDINKSLIPDNIRDKVCFIGAGEEKRSKDTLDIKIRAYKSTDEGVAFLIDILGIRIYYAGDLNYWYWSMESKQWNDSQEKAYTKELKDIAQYISLDNKPVDIAFIPIDMRLGEYYYLGLKYYMDIVGARYIFPMHLNADFCELGKLRALEDAKDYIDRIFMLENEKFEVIL